MNDLRTTNTCLDWTTLETFGTISNGKLKILEIRRRYICKRNRPTRCLEGEIRQRNTDPMDRTNRDAELKYEMIFTRNKGRLYEKVCRSRRILLHVWLGAFYAFFLL